MNTFQQEIEMSNCGVQELANETKTDMQRNFILQGQFLSEQKSPIICGNKSSIIKSFFWKASHDNLAHVDHGTSNKQLLLYPPAHFQQPASLSDFY